MQVMPTRDTARACDAGLPTYDVVIPCFNRAESVSRAVESVLWQRPAPARVILVDDGSSDDTAVVARALERRHGSVVSLLLPRNAGASAARNAGLGLVRSEWVAFLDSDDAWLPGAAPALLAATAGCDVVVGHFRRAWAGGEEGIAECGWSGTDILSALALTGAVGPSWSIIRRSSAVASGGFDPSFHNCNDWDFYVRVAAAGARFRRIDDAVALYHVAASDRLSLDEATGAANAARVRAHPSLRDLPPKRASFAVPAPAECLSPD